MDNKISALCEELQAAREAKQALQAQLEEIEETIAQLKEDLSSVMMEQGLEQCATGGYSYIIRKSYRVERTCESADLVRLFRMNHHSDYITEYVNPNSLRSFVAEELSSHDELPSWLLGSVLVHETSKLSIRKQKG